MATTKITSNVLALSAAQTNINNDGSFTLSVPTLINNTVSVSGNLTVDTNTFFVNSANNRVGIGTNNPQQAIDFRPVPYEINQSGGIRFDNTAGQWPCGIYIRSDGVGGPRLSLDAPYQNNTLNLYNNNVGIGTTTPNEKLTVVGNISAVGNLTASRPSGNSVSLSIQQGSINTWALSSVASSTALDVTSTTGSKMRLYENGDAAFGVLPGQNLLELKAGTALEIKFPFYSSYAFASNINFADYSSIGSLRSGAGFYMGTGVKTANSNGNSLLKTSLSSSQAHFFYTRYDRGLEFHSGITGNQNDIIADTTNLRSRISPEGVFYIGSNSNGTGFPAQLKIETLWTNVPAFQTKLITSQTSDHYRWTDSSNNVQGVINNLGSVGIGTATPNEKLTVVGNISATGNLTVDTNTLFVDSVNNRVGIGTVTPGSAKLVIKNDNDSSTWLLQTQNDNGNTNSLFTQNAAGDFVWNGYRNGTAIGSPELALHTNGNSFFNGGNVGIGTATPGVNLQIAPLVSNSIPLSGSASGAFAITSVDKLYGLYGGVNGSGWSWLQVGRNDSAVFYNLSLQANGGNVGVGTTTPNEKLQVANGNIGTFGNGNGFVMYNLGQGNYSGNYEMARFMPVNNEFLFQTLQGGTGVGRNLRFAIGNANLTFVNSSGNVGVSTTTPNEKLTVVGNISATGNLNIGGGLVTPITTVNTNTTLLSSNYVVLADASSSSVRIQLPAASLHTGRTYHIKKIDSTTNLVTLSGNIAETIDGLNTQAINAQYISLTIVSNGTNWFII
jgi:hypothetical protein